MPKVLVGNRGEIAIRILRSAAELGWSTVAVYTSGDTAHATFADEAVKLESTVDFMNVERIVEIARSTGCTHLHPGYGFLSESSALAAAVEALPGLTFVGPSIETLRISGDKMLSRELASRMDVHIAPGTHVKSSDDVRAFADKVGFPVMIKALDGGGGRGIRVVEAEVAVDEAFKRCLGESPSRQLFVEKALTGPGWKHIEVQIVGDGTGEAVHFWERECSVQRRFQKVVELAPSTLSRDTIQPLLDASLKMARSLKYKGLGTFEYLVNSSSHQWVFLEINPRVQVEHTVTEEITNLDLVRAQFLLSTPNTTLASLNLSSDLYPPRGYAIQLRVTAEDPLRSFQLSAGTIRASDITWPSGRAVRIETWLAAGPGSPGSNQWTVGSDFDSLLAKLIVRGATLEETTQRARRVLNELRWDSGVKTNAALLAGVVAHPDWAAGAIHTLWLEEHVGTVMELGKRATSRKVATKGLDEDGAASAKGAAAGATGGGGGGSVMLQPGVRFQLELTPANAPASDGPTKHTLTFGKIGVNAFPEKLSGTLQTTFAPEPVAFTLTQSVSAAVAGDGSSFELADLNNPLHVASPLTGKVVELHPALRGEEGGTVKQGETLVVLSVMKMESVVTAPVSGVVERKGKGIKVGVVIGEGVLLAVFANNAKSRL